MQSCWSLLRTRDGNHGWWVDDGRQVDGLSVVVGIVHAAIKPSEKVYVTITVEPVPRSGARQSLRDFSCATGAPP